MNDLFIEHRTFIQDLLLLFYPKVCEPGVINYSCPAAYIALFKCGVEGDFFCRQGQDLFYGDLAARAYSRQNGLTPSGEWKAAKT